MIDECFNLFVIFCIVSCLNLVRLSQLHHEKKNLPLHSKKLILQYGPNQRPVNKASYTLKGL